MSDFIPVNEPVIGEREKELVMECLNTGWISSEGPFVKEFEQAFAATMGRKYGIAVSNGTAALDIAIEALQIKEGDEVIVPTFTIISCINQIVRVGAIPVPVDCDPISWNIDACQIEKAITERTKAILIAHIYGLSCDLDPILQISAKYNLPIIEDAAEAIGLHYKGRACGSFGVLSTFSFYPNKHVTTGEGGMILTDDSEIASQCCSLRNLCFQSKRFIHERIGWNYRMTNIQAALGIGQLEKLSMTLQTKKTIGEMYTSYLSDIPFIQLPSPYANHSQNIYWVYGIVLGRELGVSAEQFIYLLQENGVGARPFFYPMNKQPVLANIIKAEQHDFPIANYISEYGLYLPSGVALTDNQIQRVASTFRTIIRDYIPQ